MFFLYYYICNDCLEKSSIEMYKYLINIPRRFDIIDLL